MKIFSERRWEWVDVSMLRGYIWRKVHRELLVSGSCYVLLVARSKVFRKRKVEDAETIPKIIVNSCLLTTSIYKRRVTSSR